MEKFPLISVVCLCYNHAEFIVESLDSVLSQHYSSIEIIIIDDCSTDNSVSVIETWLLDKPEITFIKNSQNLGNTKAFNLGLKIAKGDYLIDFATDDILLPNCITKQVEKFLSSTNKNLGIVYANASLIDEKGNFIEPFFKVDRNGKVLHKRESSDEYLRIITGGHEALCSVTAMVKKEVYEKLNGYDENLAYEDLDFWIRASRIYQIDFIDEILFQKRVLQNSLGTNFHRKKSPLSRKINLSTYLIIKKVYCLNRTREEDKAILKRIHYEMILNFKNAYYWLVLKLIVIELKIRLRLLYKY
ncbi:glycosyltransferase family 2 protein [Flavobacterium sp. XGLA_31]|uniref:glycosyltransferase family 2 protein n=1 Tax=Flavobacterium sp. XGLA_31 TaxID=3447666 RepID=UPI003F3D73CD